MATTSTEHQAGTPAADSSRRAFFLKTALAAAAPMLLTARKSSARDDSLDIPASPPTTPFADELPVPPVKTPVGSPADYQGGAVNPAAHQYYNLSPPKKFYETFVRAAEHRFHRDLPPSTIWGHDGIYPGPIFHARYGEPVLNRIHNELPLDASTFGMPQIITHLHNFHSAAESDGGPFDFYDTGQYLDHHYNMAYAGFDSSHPGLGDPREALNTLFYHDHRPDFTAPNVYKGLVGFFLAFDPVDSGDETDANPQALRLPSGEFDVPLLFADKAFDRDGQLFFDPFDFDGFLGDKDTVNGVIQPFFRVKRRKYRFRMLVGGPARFYDFYLRKGGAFLKQPFIQIANDGNLLPAPVRRNNLLISVAERFDVVIDFSEIAQPGDEIVLYNRAEQTDGRQPSGKLLNPGNPVLKFIVGETVPDPSQVPDILREQPVVDLNAVVRTRLFRFERGNGAWQINGKFFDPDVSLARPRRNTAEIWIFENKSGGWSHPIHVHMEEFFILSRNGRPPPVYERGRKDVVRLGPNETIKTFRYFRDFPQPGFVPPGVSPFTVGRYVIHCHNMTHEDHAMMARWDVAP